MLVGVCSRAGCSLARLSVGGVAEPPAADLGTPGGVGLLVHACCEVGRVQISKARSLSTFRSDVLLRFREARRRKGQRKNPKPGVKVIMRSRELETHLCVNGRLNAPDKQICCPPLGEHPCSTPECQKPTRKQPFHLPRNAPSKALAVVFPHLPTSPPRFRAQELRGEQQRDRTAHQPSDSRQGLLGLDGFRPPQRRGVRILFVMPLPVITLEKHEKKQPPTTNKNAQADYHLTT